MNININGCNIETVQIEPFLFEFPTGGLMNLSVEVDIPMDVLHLQPIGLSELNAKIHRESINGFYPAEIVTDNDPIKQVVHSVIQSCMRQNGEGSQTTPWSAVEQRLNQYRLEHMAFFHVEPTRKIDIRIM